jgi:hypothetical protein
LFGVMLFKKQMLQEDPVCGNRLSGTGTTNYVARWTGTSTLGKDFLYDNGTNVGIETTAQWLNYRLRGLAGYASHLRTNSIFCNETKI